MSSFRKYDVHHPPMYSLGNIQTFPFQVLKMLLLEFYCKNMKDSVVKTVSMFNSTPLKNKLNLKCCISYCVLIQIYGFSTFIYATTSTIADFGGVHFVIVPVGEKKN